MYLEYDWTFGVYRPRLGSVFISVNGIRCYDRIDDARAGLALVGLKLGRKTGSCTWEIVRL